ncbi:MAG: 30S ribosomal protein S17 [Candidatus Komeilibacteria bacterium]|nr:30S ribosomal protein S17 [Candidatus Komeilibacteria bacterium]
MKKRRLKGTVTSAKMQKNVVVRVDRSVMHPKYHKAHTVSTKYKAHDEKGLCHEGDRVVIEACRPISKDKCWRVVERSAKAGKETE